MYDVLIVGGGAAGCSAAITARMRNLSVMMVYAGDGALAKAHRVDNYPGLPQITGEDLLMRMREHAQDMGVDMAKGLVQKILPMGESFSILAGNDLYESRTILLACGTSRVQTLENEEDLLGQGVSYCATCDGMFYKGKQMIVISASAEEIHEANYLAEIGEVRYFLEKPHKTDGLSASVTVCKEKPLSITRENGRMQLKTAEGTHQADGIFVLRPAVAMTQMLPEIALKNGVVEVKADMSTNVDGVFAAGDMIGAPLQVSKATGDGNTAALSIAAYLKNTPR